MTTTATLTAARPKRAAHTGRAASKQATGNISARDLKKLITTCENAPEPNAALMKAAKAYCAR